MNCQWVQENITLYLYDDLADDARHELQHHIQNCPACAAELAAQQQFQEQMNTFPVEEPSASFLAASRMRLQEALETTPQDRAWYHRFAFDPTAWLRQVRFAPALAALLFIVGFGGGIGALYSAGWRPPGVSHNGVQPVDTASIGGITSIDKQPGSDTVQIHYDRVLPASVQGQVTDPQIQDLLMYAARSNYNSGVRLNSVDALTSKPDDPQVREALTYALRYDNNAGVRLKALDGLSAYVKQDIRVRNAVLEALLNDTNLGVRSGALHALEPVRADSSVHMALQQLAKDDPSQYIRTESNRELASMPTIY